MKGRWIRIIVVGAIASALGCSRKTQDIAGPDHSAQIRFATPRVLESDEQGTTYALAWTVDPPSEQVHSFVCALDPASDDVVDASWKWTEKPEHVVRLERSNEGHEKVHRFVVRFVDEGGEFREPASIPLIVDNLPPLVQIACPIPIDWFGIVAPPSFTIRWDGSDPDGVGTNKPVKYKYILLGPDSEYPLDRARIDPEAFRNFYVYHPDGPFAGWDSTSVDSISYTDLMPSEEDRLFAVVAFDEQGAYSPDFSGHKNMLFFNVWHAEIFGPRITMIGPGVQHTYPGGGYFNEPHAHIRCEVPDQQAVTISWDSSPGPGWACSGVRYRWVLDPVDLDDETPRSDESDVHHWSAWGPLVTEAELGPFSAPATHTLYIEAEDGSGTSLGILDLVVEPAGNGASAALRGTRRAGARR